MDICIYEEIKDYAIKGKKEGYKDMRLEKRLMQGA